MRTPKLGDQSPTKLDTTPASEYYLKCDVDFVSLLIHDPTHRPHSEMGLNFAHNICHFLFPSS